jgi:hypothetical protein
MACNDQYSDFEQHVASFRHQKHHYLENPYMQEIDSLIDEFNIKQIGKENEAQSKNQFYMSKLNHLEFILNRPADHMFENSRNNNHFGSF